MQQTKHLQYRPKWKRDEVTTGIVFVLPSLLLWLYWFLLPAVRSMRLSFYTYSYINPDQAEFVGFSNFARLFADETFLDALKHSVTLVFVVVLLITVLSFAIALMLQGAVRAKAFFRTVYYMPYIISSIAISIFFMYFFVKNGPMAKFMTIFGMKNTTWFTSTQYALPLIMIIYIWQQIGFYMILFIGGLQNIPQELYEAARIDGANQAQCIRRVTVPMMRPTTFMVVMLGLINAFQIFDQVAAISKQNPLGSPGGATSTVVTFLYQQSFKYMNMGYGSAAAMVLFLIIFLLSATRMVIGKKED